MQSAYLGFEVSNSVFLLFDVHSQNSDFFLNIFDLFGILLILLLQLPEQMICLLFQILHHQLLLLLSVDDQIILSVRFDRVRDVVIVVSHCVKFEFDLLNVLLQK